MNVNAMKNVFMSTAILLFSFSIFSCEKPDELTPADGAKLTMAGYQSASAQPVTLKGGNPIPDKQPIPDKFEWKLMKTVQLPMNKGLNLTSPFDIVSETAGDISWGSDGGCYSAIRCWKVTRAILAIVDVQTVTPDYLKTLTFVSGQVAWAPGAAPGYTPTWTNYMPVGTVIAYKTSLGKFRLVVVKSAFPLILDIYYENFYRVY